MNESYSKTNKKINTLSLDDIYKTLNKLLNNIQNDINILAYLESSITNNKHITPQDAHQTILLNLKKLKIDSIKIKKQIEDFSFNNNNFNKYNQYRNDGIIKNTIKTYNEKYKKLLFNIKVFMAKYPILIDLREEFLNNKLNSFSFKKIKKNKNKTLSISNVKNKNNNSFGNYKNKNNNNNNISDRNISINDYINSNSKKLKIDMLKNKIKKIQINFDGSQLDTTNEKSSKIYDKSHITTSNRYINDLKLKSFVKNSTNTNIINDLNLNNSISREKLLFIPKNKSFLKRENPNIISNKSYQVHNSFNNSSINLNVTNHKHINKNNNINYINKFIPNNYRRKNQMNSLENSKKLQTNPNIQNYRLIGKTAKNNKSFNFPIKSILFEQNLNKKIKFKKLKPSITLKDKDKINCTYITTTCQGINKINNNNLKSYKGILYTKPVKNEKRSNSEYFLKSVKNDINISKINNNSSMNNSSINNNKKLRGFSLDNLNWNKLDIPNLEKNVIKKKKTKLRNRAINIFSESSCNGAATAPNRNMSFNQFVNNKVINNDKVEFENISNHENIIIDYDKYINTREENTKLKKEVISLKKEIENLKFMYQDLSMKVSNLEEQNEILKKENNTIKFCNMYQK